MPFLDELQAGSPVLGAPDLESTLGLAHGGMGLWLFTAPLLVSFVVEPVLVVWSERFPRRKVLAVALATMAVGQLGLASVTTPWTLSLALSVWGVATGLAATIAQLALVSEGPQEIDRTMARWTLFASLGDLMSPLLVAGVALVSGSWRMAVVVTSVLAALDAAVVLLVPDPDGAAPDDEEGESEPVIEALRRAASNPRVLLWAMATASCTLFDEIFLVFGGLLIVERGGDLTSAAMQFTACSLGGTLGLAWLQRQHFDPRRVLVLSSLVTLVAFAFWLRTPLGLGAVAWMFLLGVAVANLYPLTMARTYEAFPERPAIVAALEQPFAVFDLVAPVVLGVVADRWGLSAALSLLVIQPVTIVAITRLTRSSPRAASPAERPPEVRIEG